MEHSIIPPSSAHIWGSANGCTGWVLMSHILPQDSCTEDSANGEAAHELGARMILSASRGGADFPSECSTIDSYASNGALITQDMYESALCYANDVIDVMRSEGCFTPQVESKVHANRVHDLSWGTCDCYLFCKHSSTLYVWDFKHGFSVVEAFENLQLINYVAGILDELGVNGYSDQNIKVHIRIAQPRAPHREGPIREWVVMASDLRGLINQLSNKANEALSDGALLRAGPHCLHCDHKIKCSEFLKYGLAIYQSVSDISIVDLSTSSKATLLSIAKEGSVQLSKLSSALEDDLKAEIRSGNAVPGYIVEPTYGRDKWSASTEELEMLGWCCGVELTKKVPITPNQAIKAGVDEALVREKCFKPNTGYKLVPDTGSKARKVFG